MGTYNPDYMSTYYILTYLEDLGCLQVQYYLFISLLIPYLEDDTWGGGGGGLQVQ